MAAGAYGESIWPRKQDVNKLSEHTYITGKLIDVMPRTSYVSCDMLVASVWCGLGVEFGALKEAGTKEGREEAKRVRLRRNRNDN